MLLTAYTVNLIWGFEFAAALIGLGAGLEAGFWVGNIKKTFAVHRALLFYLPRTIVNHWGVIIYGCSFIIFFILMFVAYGSIYEDVNILTADIPLYQEIFYAEGDHWIIIINIILMLGAPFFIAPFFADNAKKYDDLPRNKYYLLLSFSGWIFIGLGFLIPLVAVLAVYLLLFGVLPLIGLAVLIYTILALVILAGTKELHAVAVGITVGGFAGLAIGGFTGLNLLPTLGSIAAGAVIGMVTGRIAFAFSHNKALLRLAGKIRMSHIFTESQKEAVDTTAQH
jgi:hypothetical protein